MKSRNPIAFGIVGCGTIARYHARAIQELPEAVLVGACSRNLENAKKFSREFSVPVFQNYDRMLALPELDVAVICATSGAHYSLARQALLARKHVVIEKPMCLRPEECDDLIQLSKGLERMVCTISQTRFSDAAVAVKSAVVQGSFGSLVSSTLSIRYQRPQSYYDATPWRGTMAGEGGGVLMNQGIHGIDLLCYLVGKPAKVCGFARRAL